ncbi:MAG: sulfatase [Phycisphaerae bacterium]|nr:sulfatase [Phycisphaerae bacterium]
MRRRDFLRGLGATLAAMIGSSAVGRQAPKKKTNFIFFLIDDLGWTDVGCYGSRYYETPNIDRLARGGMRFSDAYAASCVCSPTRASILTGKYPGRLHITHAIPIQGASRLKGPLPLLPAIYTKNLPLEEVTIAEALKDAGYVSASMGKWHVCWDKGYYPEDQGFDLNVGGNNMGNPGNYFHPYQGSWRMTSKHPLIRWNTLPDGKPGEYLTDRLTDEAVKFIDKNRQRPFFLYLSHYAVHTPIQAKKKILAKYKKKPKAKRHKNAGYAAMIESVDQSVGRVLKKLDDLGLADRTVVIFASDNGGHGRITSHHPLRGNKGNFYEGGIRVPLIVKWPGVVKPGSQCPTPVISTDFYPTMLAMAGLPLRPEQHIDGKNIVPLLKQSGGLKRDALYWHFPNYIGAGHPNAARPCSVIRKGDWKLIEFLEDNRVELYNLKDDLSEKTDLASKMPDKANALRRMLEQWRKDANVQMPKPNPKYRPQGSSS